MSEEETSKPKIIVDDDWKSRAQAEKEQLQKATAAKQPPAEPPASEPTPPPPEPASHEPLPPASFSVLVMSLATQALASMGQIPGADGKPVIELDHAKHFIDTLGILDEKTKGNLTPHESEMLTRALHELRLLFVTVGKQDAAAKKEGK